MKKLLLSLVFLFSISFISAQDADEAAKLAINTMKENCLVVRLESHHRKISELTRLASKGDLSDKTRAALSEKLKRMMQERDAKNLLWMQYFNQHFNFSKVLFTYDTTSVELLKTQSGKNSFLNDSLKIEPSIRLESGTFTAARFGATDTQEGTGVDALIFQNSDFEDLQKPFPYYVKLTYLGYYFNKLLAKELAEPRNTERVVKKANERLREFYKKVN